MLVINNLATMDWSSVLGQLNSEGAAHMSELGIEAFLLLMVISALSGLFVSLLYRVFFRARATGSEMHRAFPLISLSVTAIFITIQFSLPLSLGLLGALSIVRFRTPVKEPEEIGFLMLVVAGGLCCATFNLTFLGVVMGTAVGMLLLVHARRGVLGGPRKHGMVVVTVSSEVFRSSGPRLLAALSERMPEGRIDSINDGPDEAVLSYSFPKLEQDEALDVQTELRKIDADVRTDLFFSRGA